MSRAASRAVSSAASRGVDPSSLPSLAALALLVAVVDEGSLGAGARRLGMAQPNASRLLRQLEADAGTGLLQRHPRGSRPTSAGLVFAAHARELLEAAQDFSDWLAHTREAGADELPIGVSLTIAEHLMPAWLTTLRNQVPGVRVSPHVLNSTQVLERVRGGDLPLGFVETPHVPSSVRSRVITDDELVVLVAPHHPWADRRSPLTIEELARPPLVVREGGSGTRDAFEELVPAAAATAPVQELSSNAAVRLAVASGAGPAVLSRRAALQDLASGTLLRVPLHGGHRLVRPLTAVWSGPQRMSGPAALLLDVASRRC